MFSIKKKKNGDIYIVNKLKIVIVSFYAMFSILLITIRETVTISDFINIFLVIALCVIASFLVKKINKYFKGTNSSIG